MRIVVIQASTRTEINQLLFDTVCEVVDGHHDVVNLGVFPEEIENYTYMEVAVMISLLIETNAADFVVTGCSSGQGMMMACNSLPGLRCGFVQTPQDAYLFGRINNGNVVSLPLGLNFGWSGELNLRYTLEKLFEGEFNTGYPVQDAERKKKEATELVHLHQLTTRSFLEILPNFNEYLLTKILRRKTFVDYIYQNGTNKLLLEKLTAYKV
ncbi:ribose/galactose Isomerase [Streptococcus suis]|uniref:Ribose/galactose Isomerase n=1 Tax=Streptococcus suis TaxID=1307 RepID=A0A0Z8FVA7_STRSU|nr:RpiB/LacA/LacB family sugar-phosphate isomerase [Streptococcus suis]NQH35336.1 RpiB/LacA/LacB family sugar-phosphate isomerase [Streptococcus suis]CYU87298.1 ribose/galactose Isomerase [Streptococcus suis]